MNISQRLYVARKFSDWMITVDLSKHLNLIAEIIRDCLRFLDDESIIKVFQILESETFDGINPIWIDTAHLLTLGTICKSNQYYIGSTLIFKYIDIVHNKEVSERIINELVDLIRRQHVDHDYI